MYRPNMKNISLKLNRLIGRLHRALGADNRSQKLLISQKSNNNTTYTNTYSHSHVEIKRILLNVERRKAEALMERTRRIY